MFIAVPRLIVLSLLSYIWYVLEYFELGFLSTSWYSALDQFSHYTTYTTFDLLVYSSTALHNTLFCFTNSMLMSLLWFFRFAYLHRYVAYAYHEGPHPSLSPLAIYASHMLPDAASLPSRKELLIKRYNCIVFCSNSC